MEIIDLIKKLRNEHFDIANLSNNQVCIITLKENVFIILGCNYDDLKNIPKNMLTYPKAFNCENTKNNETYEFINYYIIHKDTIDTNFISQIDKLQLDFQVISKEEFIKFTQDLTRD